MGFNPLQQNVALSQHNLLNQFQFLIGAMGQPAVNELGVPGDSRGFNYGFKLKENSQHDLAPVTDEEDEGKPPSVVEDPVPLESYT